MNWRLLSVLLILVLAVPSGEAVTYEVVAELRAPGPLRPKGALVPLPDAGLIGTSREGGINQCGTVYRVTPKGEITVIHRFTPGKDGILHPHQPEAGLIEGPDGWFHGTTQGGDIAENTRIGEGGATFRIKLDGQYEVTSYLNAGGGKQTGGTPEAPLFFTRTGRLLGTARNLGPGGYGSVFEVLPNGSAKALVGFTGNDGPHPGSVVVSSVVEDSKGNILGTTVTGGRHGYGTIFRIDLEGKHETLVHFTGATGDAPGSNCRAALTPLSDGSFLGTTANGGAKGSGTVFHFTPPTQIRTIVNLPDRERALLGTFPVAPLIDGGDGWFYGTAARGGKPIEAITKLDLKSASNGKTFNGTIFRVRLDGTAETLVDFTGCSGSAPGREPSGPLARGNDGHLYGTTYHGGSEDRGVIYRLRLP